MNELITNAHFEGKAVFMESGDIFTNCTFKNCTLVYYEDSEVRPSVIRSTFIGGMRVQAFCKYLEEVNMVEPFTVTVNAPRADSQPKRPETPWYVNSGRKW